MSHLLGRLRAFALLLLPATVAAQDKFFESNGVQIRYIDQGTGEPVVLIHPYTGSIEAWIGAGILPDLARDHRVIASDLRGHGKSGKPRDPKAYGQELGQDVVRLLDHLRIRRAHIVGYSLGATVTAKLLITNPDRFMTATLGAYAGSRSWTLEDQQTAEAAAVELEGETPFRSAILATAPTDGPPPTEDVIRRRSKAFAAGNDPLALAALNRGRVELAVSPAQMAAVQVPTLGIVDSADGFVVGMKELKTILPSLQLIVIEGATHGGGRGAARTPRFVNAVREFIAAHKGTSSR